MEALRTHDIEEGGERRMESTMTDIDGGMGTEVKEVYLGPSALWIASRLAHSVRYSQGWFWTTAVCHSLRDNGLAFRQRPDGNGIDVKCHTRGCSRDDAIAGLEMATGAAIGSAYTPTAGSDDRSGWLMRHLVWWGTASLLFAATLLFGLGLQAAILTWLSFGLGGLLIGRPMPRRRIGRPTP